MNLGKYCKKNAALGVALALMSVCPTAMAETANQEITTTENINQIDSSSIQVENVVNEEQQSDKEGKSPDASATSQIEEIESNPVNELLPPIINEKAEKLEGSPGTEEQAVGKTVTSVEIIGNKIVPVDKFYSVLRIKPGVEFSAESVNQDMQMIYETGWFYDVQAEYSFIPEGVQITYKVFENPVLKNIEIIGDTIYSEHLLARLVGLEVDEVINSKRLNEGMRNIEAAYNRDGYILARVSDVQMQEDGVLKVTINEGIVEGFNIKGLKKTQEKVVLRELKLYEGEPFNVNDGRTSMQRLYNLGYFEDVNIKLNPGRTPNGVEVEIDVVEMATGTFGVGAGYSEADGLVGMVMVGDRNFRGTGDKIDLRWEFGGADNKNYDFSYYRPWLTNSGVGMGINLYDLTNEYEELFDNGNKKDYYDKRRRGIEWFLTKPANDYITDSLTIKFRKDIYRGGVDGKTTHYYDTNPAEIAKNFGSTHSIMLARNIDTRDNVYNPSTGSFTRLSAEFAGLIGGDFDFNKFIFETRSYTPIGLNKVFAVRFVAGYATGTMPLGQRFTVGGSDYLRGYKDDRFFGYKMLAGTAEYRFPITKNFQGVVFGDAGYAWDKGDNFNLGDIEFGYGFGIRINSPMGPIRLDYAYGDKWRIHFGFGGQF